GRQTITKSDVVRRHLISNTCAITSRHSIGISSRRHLSCRRKLPRRRLHDIWKLTSYLQARVYNFECAGSVHFIWDVPALWIVLILTSDFFSYADTPPFRGLNRRHARRPHPPGRSAGRV